MLKSLLIKDYALIENIEVEFGKGLNIITGETGAGKSILCQRAKPRTAASRAKYTAIVAGCGRR